MEASTQLVPGLGSTKDNSEELVLEVTCGQNTALLYMSRLQLGSKGTCLLFENAWLTPNEFQYVSGRETAKDWKRSIKHYGKSLKVLISKNILTTSTPCCCNCEQCAQTNTGTTVNKPMDGPKPPPPGHPSLDPIHSGAGRNSEISSMESSTNQNLTSLTSELQHNALPVHTQNSDSMVGGQKSSNHHSTSKPANDLDWKGNKMGEYGSNVADQANRGKAREEVMRPQQPSHAESFNGQGYQMRENTNGQDSTTFHNDPASRLASKDASNKQPSTTTNSSSDRKPLPKTSSAKPDPASSRPDDKFKAPPERPTAEQSRVASSAASSVESCQYNPAYAAPPNYAALRNGSAYSGLMDSPFMVNPYYPMLSAPQLPPAAAAMYYNNPYMMWPSMSATSAFTSSTPSNPYSWTPSGISEMDSDIYPGSLFPGAAGKPSEPANPSCGMPMFSFPWMNKGSYGDPSQFSNLMLDGNAAASAQFKADALSNKRKMEDDMVRRSIKQPCLFNADAPQMPGSGLREANYKPLLSGFYPPPYMPSGPDPRNMFANGFVGVGGNNYNDFRNLYSNFVSSPFGGMSQR